VDEELFFPLKEQGIMWNNRSSVTGGIASGIVLIGLALAFLFGGFNLPIFFIALAFASLVGSMSSRNPQGIYGGIQGFFWLLALAIFFITGSWIVFLLAAGVSAILGSLARPIIAGLGSLAFFGMAQPPPQQYYQPPQPYQSPQQPYQSYQEGYQPPGPQSETYQEGGQQYPYPSQPAQQYEEPHAQYPQQMPPQQ
jgi:hypothetical protein